jgi:hypothetical protein
MTTYLLNQALDDVNPEESTSSLESGNILFFPNHYYERVELELLSESILDSRHKNVSFDYQSNKLGAFKKEQPGLDKQLISLMRGYAEFSQRLIEKAVPSYGKPCQWIKNFTSFL